MKNCILYSEKQRISTIEHGSIKNHDILAKAVKVLKINGVKLLTPSKKMISYGDNSSQQHIKIALKNVNILVTLG